MQKLLLGFALVLTGCSAGPTYVPGTGAPIAPAIAAQHGTASVLVSTDTSLIKPTGAPSLIGDVGALQLLPAANDLIANTAENNIQTSGTTDDAEPRRR